LLHAGYPENQTHGEDSSPAGATRKGSTGKEYVSQVLWGKGTLRCGFWVLPY